MGDIITAILVSFFLGAAGGYILAWEGATTEFNTKAIQSGCAVRYLDTLSGDVKTVWKGEKE